MCLGKFVNKRKSLSERFADSKAGPTIRIKSLGKSPKRQKCRRIRRFFKNILGDINTLEQILA